MSDGASHPSYISYYPAQLQGKLPLGTHAVWGLPRFVGLALPVGGECLDAIWFHGSLPRSKSRSCRRLTFMAIAVIACDHVMLCVLADTVWVV